jgi:putative transposase
VNFLDRLPQRKYDRFMPRVARVVIPEIPHHVTQRGNNRQDVFFVKDDRRVYLDILREQCLRYGLTVLGYCLMTNHIHLIATPWQEDSLARAMGRTDVLYAQYINRLHGRSGHLWQNRFFSCALDEEYFWQALRYVERNPVRAGMVEQAWEYPWSSAAGHVTGMDRGKLIDLTGWPELSAGLDWRQELSSAEDEKRLSALRSGLRRGRPLGSDRFISKLEVLLSRRLRPLPPGRPKKAKEEKDGEMR